MSLVEAKCTNCGAKMEVDNTKEAAICPNCNSAFIVEKAINNITNNIKNENNISNSNVTIINNESISLKNGVFEGESKSGKPHGYGVCQYSNGFVYEGNWLAGARCGEGTITYDDGSKWSGVWKNDKPWEGKGKLIYASGYYEGEYKNGKANGQGTYCYNNGKKWSGIVKDNEEWTGEGYIEYFDSVKVYQTYEGKIKDGKHDDNGEWHCNGHFTIDDVTFDVTKDVLNYILTSSSQPLTIPNGIKSVEESILFYDITEIKCPKSLTTFNIKNLRQLEKLESFEAPGIINVPDRMFCNLESLKSVKFENAETIGEEAFKNCFNLSHVYIPKVKRVKTDAFGSCESLYSLDLPNVQKIEAGAYQSSGIVELVAPKLKEIGDEAFFNCEYLEKIQSPVLKTIGKFAFRYCNSITEFSSDTVTLIKDCAFSGCKGLISASFPNAVLEKREDNTYHQFFRCDKLTNIHLSENIDISKVVTIPKKSKSNGCYIATAVYGSYDCPEVWTLRRFRDYTLAGSWYGRLFIRIYYAISPTIVKWFGNTRWFNNIWKRNLDRIVAKLRARGVESTFYEDKKW